MCDWASHENRHQLGFSTAAGGGLLSDDRGDILFLIFWAVLVNLAGDTDTVTRVAF